MRILQKLREINQAFDIRKKTDYVFKRWIFITALSLSIVFIFIVFLQTKTLDYQYYTKCPELPEGSLGYGTVCENSLYLKCDKDICQLPYLEYGKEYGTKPPKILKYSNWLIYGLLFSAFVLNHLIYNKGRKFRLNVEIEEDEN